MMIGSGCQSGYCNPNSYVLASGQPCFENTFRLERIKRLFRRQQRAVRLQLPWYIKLIVCISFIHSSERLQPAPTAPGPWPTSKCMSAAKSDNALHLFVPLFASSLKRGIASVWLDVKEDTPRGQ
jgi:hypothetical protein